MPRWGKTRYGHVFSEGKAGVAWVGKGSWRGRRPDVQGEGERTMPEVENRPALRVTSDLLQLRVGEVIDQGVRLRISCDNCQHESIWTQGYMEKKLKKLRAESIRRMANKLRCGGCRSNYVRVWRG